MRLLYVPLTRPVIDALLDRARIQRRRPQDEAAILLERALGMPPAHQTCPARDPQPSEEADADPS